MDVNVKTARQILLNRILFSWKSKILLITQFEVALNILLLSVVMHFEHDIHCQPKD